MFKHMRKLNSRALDPITPNRVVIFMSVGSQHFLLYLNTHEHTQLVRRCCHARRQTSTLRYEMKQLAIYQSKVSFSLDGGKEPF